jgi:hypothetical protein
MGIYSMASGMYSARPGGMYKQGSYQNQMVFNSKKIQQLSRQVYQNRGELRTYDRQGSLSIGAGATQAIDLCSLAQGDGIGERTGQKITLKGLKIRIAVTNTIMDVYLINAKLGTIPDINDFYTSADSHLKSSTKHLLTEMAYLRNYMGQNLHVKYNRRYKTGMPILYTSTTGAPVRNRIFLIVRNLGTVAHTIDYNVLVSFTDS